MARARIPDGRRVPVSIKLSDAEAAVIDAVRGELERGPWMREAALSAARGTGAGRPAAAQHGILKRGAVPGRGRTPRTTPPPAPVSRRLTDAEAGLITAEQKALSSDQGEPAPARKQCPPHPKARVAKGFCSLCRRGVLPGEKVA